MYIKLYKGGVTKKMKEDIFRFLADLCKTPRLSKELQDGLINKFNISETYARVIITRAVDQKYIYKSVNNKISLKFDNGSFAYSNTIGNNQFFELLAKHKPYLSDIFHLMNEQNCGYVSYLDIEKISACRIKSDEKHLSLSKVLEEIKFFYQIKTVYVYGNKFVINKKIFPTDEVNLEKVVQKESVNCKILYWVLSYLQKLNIIEGRPLYRNKDKPFTGKINNNMVWDAVSFSRIKNFNQREKAIAYIDFNISNKYSPEEFNGFRARIENACFSVQKGLRNILPIIICNSIYVELKREASRLGYVIVELPTIFGSEICRIIECLYSLDNEKDPRILFNLIQTIKDSGQSDNLGNLKGELFERVCRDVLDRLIKEANSMTESNKIINGEEIDYIMRFSDEMIMFEFKSGKFALPKGKYNAKTKEVSDYSFKRIFSKFDRFRNNYKADVPIKLCIISCSGFTAETKEVATQQNKHQSKRIPMLVSGEELIQLCKTSVKLKEFKREIEVIEQFFIKPHNVNN